MQVQVSVLGRHRAFALAGELCRRDHLRRLHTSRPLREALRLGFPAECLASAPHFELGATLAAHLARHSGGRLDPRARVGARWARRVAARLEPDADVFVGRAGASLDALRRARELGMLPVLEAVRGHVRHRDDVLAREYERLGVRGRPPHARKVERELVEVDLAERILVPSSFARETFLAQGVPEEKLVLLPYGIQREPVPTVERDGNLRILHMGEVSVRTGCHHLIQAFRELDLPGTTLWLAGPVADDIVPFLKRSGRERMVLFGRLTSEEVRNILGRASVLVSAALEEGPWSPVPRAMASGLAVVASDASGAGDLLRHGTEGHVFPAGDVDALAAHLLSLWGDRVLREELGRAASERAATASTWADYGERAVGALFAAVHGLQEPAPEPLPALLTATEPASLP